MIKFCPIMSFRHENDNGIYCRTDECAWWNEEKDQCCFKTMALAAEAKPSGGTSSTAQAYYIPPSSYCQTNAISDKIIDDSYQLTRDISIAPVLRERG